MGCDIHLYVEKRVDGKWVSADTWEPDECDEGGEKRLTIPNGKRFYAERNYQLFALLADVRNYENITPICPPRGMPDDASELVSSASRDWDGDGHTHSWLTLAELLAFDWTQTFKARGIVSAKECAEWLWSRDYNPEPDSWCRGISGSQVQMVPFAEMEQKLKQLAEACNDADGFLDRQKYRQGLDGELGHYYCEVEWEINFARIASDFWWRTIPALLRLGKPEDVRIVFWFDN